MNQVDKVAVCSRSFSLNKILRTELLSKYKNVTFNDSGVSLSGDSLISFLSGHSMAITALEIIDDHVLSSLPDLKVIGKYGVGLDMIDLKSMKKHNKYLGWKSGVNKRSVSELSLLLALSIVHKAFEANNLPNLFCGFHYFEKSDKALEFYQLLELVMQNWQAFYEKFLEGVTRPKHVSVDVCVAIVAMILDCVPEITNPNVDFPSFTHMKKNCQGWMDSSSNWQDRVGFYISRDCEIKIGNHAQTGILHYTEKDFLEKSPVLERYRNFVNV